MRGVAVVQLLKHACLLAQQLLLRTMCNGDRSIESRCEIKAKQKQIGPSLVRAGYQVLKGHSRVPSIYT